MDTSERSTEHDSLAMSDSSLAKSSSLPSISTLFVVSLLIPALAAISSQWLLAHSNQHSWPLNYPGAPFWIRYLLYPWMAIAAAAVSWTSGRYLYPAFLRTAVFVWCLILLDLLMILASFSSSRDSQFGYMLLSAQVNLLILWTILGPGGWQWRLPLMVAAAPLILIFGTSIGSAWWLETRQWYRTGGWYWQSWQFVVLLAAVIAAVLYISLRRLGFSLRSDLRATPSADSQTVRITQFGVKHMLTWATAIVPLLLVARGADLISFTNFRQNEVFPAVLLSVSLATISLVAIWVVLGAGSWFVRLPFLILAPLVTAFALEWCSRAMILSYGASPRFRNPIVELFIEMNGSWFAWIVEGTALLAALLLFLRASGYHFARSVRKPKAGT